MGDALAGTLAEAQSYTDALETRANLTFATNVALAGALSETLIAANSYSDGIKTYSDLTFYTKAATDDAMASTLAAASSYTDELEASASTTFATKAALNGVEADAALALDVAVDAEGVANAVIGLTSNVNDLITGFRSENDGSTSRFDILADRFGLFDPGGGAKTEYYDGIWRTFDAAGSYRSMYGGPFGGTQLLTLWVGPASIPMGSENKDSAYVYVSMNTVGGPRFGGLDVPIGSGFQVTQNSLGRVGTRSGAGSCTSSLLTLTPHNATGTVTYEWTQISGDPMTITSPTGAATAFRADLAAGQTKQGAFAWRSYDSGSGMQDSGIVAATLISNV